MQEFENTPASQVTRGYSGCDETVELQTTQIKINTHQRLAIARLLLTSSCRIKCTRTQLSLDSDESTNTNNNDEAAHVPGNTYA